MPRVEAHLHITRYRSGAVQCISVRELPSGLVRYRADLALTDVKFAVQPAGYAKWQATGVKNVHAYVRGHVLYGVPKTDETWRKVSYRPTDGPYFFDTASGDRVESATAVKMVGSSMFYLP